MHRMNGTYKNKKPTGVKGPTKTGKMHGEGGTNTGSCMCASSSTAKTGSVERKGKSYK
jgi:hypothetical protein